MNAPSAPKQAMFTDELDRLRLQVKEAQEDRWRAERERDQFAEKYSGERNRADNLTAAQRKLQADVDQMKTLLADTRRTAEKVPGLEQAAIQAQERANLMEQQAAGIAKLLADEEQITSQLSQELSNTKAELGRAHQELEPTRKIVAAWKTRVEADAIIAQETARL